MGAYDNIDQAIEGLQYGLLQNNRIEGGWVATQEDGIEFGRPVFGYVDDELNLYNFLLDVGKLVFDGDFVTGNSIDITVNGVAAATVPFNSTHNITAGDVVTAISALTGVKCILDPADGTNRTFLIQTKGFTALVTEDVTGGAGQASGTITYFSSQVFVGVSIFVQNSPGLYEQYDAVNVMADGELWVKPTLAIEAQEDAYVDNESTDISTFTNSTVGVLVNAKYRSSGAADALVRLFVHGQTDMTYAGTF